VKFALHYIQVLRNGKMYGTSISTSQVWICPWCHCPLRGLVIGKKFVMLFDAGVWVLFFLDGVCFFGEAGGLGFFEGELLRDSDGPNLAFFAGESGVDDR